MTHFQIKSLTPPLDSFIEFRKMAGWGEISIETARSALNNSFLCACIYIEEELIGFGRVIGDNALYLYIQDFIIKEPYQGQGYGAKLLEYILASIRMQAIKGTTIGLMAAKDKDGFYEKYGFKRRPNEYQGAGMIMVL